MSSHTYPRRVDYADADDPTVIHEGIVFPKVQFFFHENNTNYQLASRVDRTKSYVFSKDLYTMTTDGTKFVVFKKGTFGEKEGDEFMLNNLLKVVCVTMMVVLFVIFGMILWSATSVKPLTHKFTHFTFDDFSDYQYYSPPRHPPQKKKNYYAVLGLDSSASQKDIRNAYHALALKYHPDRHKNCGDCAEKFAEISNAFAELTGAEKESNPNYAENNNNNRNQNFRRRYPF